MPPTELRKRDHGDGELIKQVELPTIKIGSPETKSNRKLVGVDGLWYDVTTFLPHHPGGPIMEKFIGEDASQVFHAYGHEKVLKYRKPVAQYPIPERHPADAEFEDLVKMFKAKGYYKTDWMFYVQKTSVVIMLYALVFYLVIGFEQWYMHYIGAVVLAFFWQQCGFIMHEFMHSQVFRQRFKDRFGGCIFGTTFFGISAHWWQDEHIIHHGMTNVVNVANRFADPQMWESVWAQDPKMYPLFKGLLAYILIKIQHITFIPVVVFIGRYEIVSDSFRRERRWYEWVAWMFHWMWMTFLLSYLPTWREVGIFYFIAASVEGIFHFQLILSHYCKLFLNEDEFHSASWYESMILTNMNIDTYRWLYWYYGGLNFHIEHHLFPKMARKHLGDAAPYVEDVCKRHGIEYDSCSFYEAICKTLVHLKSAGTHYKLDPR